MSIFWMVYEGLGFCQYTNLLKIANSRSLKPLSLDIAVGPTNVSAVCLCNLPNFNIPLVQPECLSLVFGLWLPGVAGRSGQPHCHHVRKVRKTIRYKRNSVPDLTQVISWEKTAQKDTTKDIASDSQVNSSFPHRWSPANLTFNIFFYLFLYLYMTRRTINNNILHIKSLKNQNRRAVLGQPAI